MLAQSNEAKVALTADLAQMENWTVYSLDPKLDFQHVSNPENRLTLEALADAYQRKVCTPFQ